MPWTSDTSYTLEQSDSFSRLIATMGKPLVGKTYLTHQWIMAHGHENVVVGDSEGLLDSIAPYRPIIEPMRDRKEVGALLKRFQDTKPDNLPKVFVWDNMSDYGDKIEAEAENMTWEGRDEIAKNVAKYRWIATRMTNPILALKQLAIPIIVVNFTSEVAKIKDENDRTRVVEQPIVPGAKFNKNLARKINCFLSLRRYNENGKVRLEFSTEGPWYAMTGERTGKLNPVEPANYPALVVKMGGLAPIYPVECDLDGTMRRAEE
jgi:hypothetical protein